MPDYIEDLKRQAEEGKLSCMIELGNSYLCGFDIEGNPFPLNFDKAKDWLEKARSKGATTASLLLGTIYEKGLGVNRDVGMAISLYEESAKTKNIFSHLYLARIFSDISSAFFDEQKANSHYRSVVEQEDELDDSAADIVLEARKYLNTK